MVPVVPGVSGASRERRRKNRRPLRAARTSIRRLHGSVILVRALRRRRVVVELCAVVLVSGLLVGGVVRLQQEKVRAQRIDRNVQLVQDKVGTLEDLTTQLLNIATAPGVPASAVQSGQARETARELQDLLTKLLAEDPNDQNLTALADRTRGFVEAVLFVVDNTIPPGPTREVPDRVWKDRVEGLRRVLVTPLHGKVSALAHEEVVRRDIAARRADAWAAWGSGGLTGGLVLILVLGATHAARTRQRAVQESLARGRRRLEALNSNLSDVITVLDGEGIVTYQSPSLGAGLEPGRVLTELVHPDDAAALHAVVSDPAGGAGPLELRVRHADGAYRWWESTITNLVDEPAVRGLVLTSRDITERKQVEDAVRNMAQQLERRVAERTAALEQANVGLEQANKELEAFSYSVSHDLRAPLRSINGFSSLLLKRYRDSLDAKGQHYLDRMQAGTVRMGLLIDDILAFSRMARADLAMEMVDVTSLAREVFAELNAAAGERRIRLVLDDLPPVCCDRAMIRQVLTNLMGNAVKYTGPRPEAVITVTGEVTENENIYQVADNGVGFDMRGIDKLFGVFQRLHSADEFEGSGAGLAIVKRIVIRHGGRVWAEGEVGVGATFSFALPRPQQVSSQSGLRDGVAGEAVG